jgi:hypothetical protein
MDVQISPEYEALSKISFAIGTPDAIIGTGFFFRKDGWALTARHVISKLPGDAIPINYRHMPSYAQVKHEFIEHDVAILYAPEVKVEGSVPLGGDWKREDPVVVVGYQQPFFRGLNPLELHIEPNKPVRDVLFKDGVEQECLILDPRNPNYIIQEGTSGGPILDKRTRCIIGIVVGTTKDGGSGTFGMASLLSKLILDCPPVRDLLLVEHLLLAHLDDVLTEIISTYEKRFWQPEVAESAFEVKLPMCLVPPPPAVPCFEMAVYLVTNREFKEFVDAHSYWRPGGACRREKKVDDKYLSHWSHDIHKIAAYPVVNVSWYAAQAYADWLGNQLEKPLRLPSDEEWEMAALAGRSWEACLNEELRPDRVRVNYHFIVKEISPVGTFDSNPYGLYDILGNVSELCGSREDTSAYACGGAYNAPRTLLKQRLPLKLNECREDTGFRCVHDLSSIKEENYEGV